MKNFLLSASGVNSELLSCCPTEENKFVCLGAAVLITAEMATASGALFGRVILHLPTSAALLLGVGAGLAVYGMDRLLLSSMTRHASLAGEIGAALPRVALSLLIGAVFSEPLILTIYAPEISTQLARNQEEARRKAQQQLETNPRYQEITSLRAANADLTAQMRARQEERDTLWQAYTDEAEGRAGTGIVGKGPVFREKGERLKQAKAEKQAADRGDQATLTASQRRLDALQQEKDTELRELDYHEGQSTGLLAQEAALEQITDRNPPLAHRRLILMLFLMALDCLPVFAKVMQSLTPHRPYLAVLEAAEERVLQDARLAIEDARAETDSELMRRRVRREVDQQAEEDAARRILQKTTEVKVDLAEAVLAGWEARERQKIDDDLDAYL